MFNVIKNIPPFLKFYAYGKDDPLIQRFVAERGIIYYTYGERSLKKEKKFNITLD